jgi:hypothetical protein
MKYIKLYEENIVEPKKGDYVVLKRMSGYYKDEIGKIDIIDYQYPGKNYYKIYIEDYPSQIRYWFSRAEILYFSDNREDVDIFLNTQKYNL